MREAYETFQRVFGREATLAVRAPGRVNLIGDHTDYNDGYVLPMAIDLRVIALAAPNGTSAVRLYSDDYAQQDSFDLTAIAPSPDIGWSNYVRGVAQALKERAVPLVGADLATSGDVPRGAGLSSSAALEMASGYALATLAGMEMDRVELALCGQEAEHRYAGVQSGIMDQFASALGQADSALRIDCRDLSYQVVPLGLARRAVRVVVVESGVQRTLVGSAYNTRRRECEEGARLLQAALPGRRITSLRDVTMEDLQRSAQTLPDHVARRVRHVVSENERVLRSLAALRAGDLTTFGRLMRQSHVSLRDDYEVTVPDVDRLIELAWALPGVLGARMTGAGFGGATVHLVRTDAMERFGRDVVERYMEETGRRAQIYICDAANGVSVLTPDGSD